MFNRSHQPCSLRLTTVVSMHSMYVNGKASCKRSPGIKYFCVGSTRYYMGVLVSKNPTPLKWGKSQSILLNFSDLSSLTRNEKVLAVFKGIWLWCGIDEEGS